MSFIEWRPIPDYEDYYEASSDGRVRSVDRKVPDNNQYETYSSHMKGRVLKPQIHRNRKVVCLSKHGNTKYIYIHRLVCAAFHGAPEPKQVAMHLDNDPDNNVPSNLRWGTHRENIQQAVDDGLMPRGEEVKNSKLNRHKVLKIRKLRKAGYKLREISDRFKVSEGMVSRICAGKDWAWV